MGSSNKRVEVIDGLRGFAILIVAWYHFWQQSWLWADFTLFGQRISLSFIPRVGFFGVEIFFVISGFCIFLPYAGSKFGNKPKPDIKTYCKKRLIKIVPSYYLFLLITVPLTENFPSHIDKPWYLLRHLLGINSLFPDTFHSLYNGVLWSLSVEIQFYVLFPLICWIMLKSPIATFLTVFSFANFYRLFVLVVYPSKFSFLFNQLPGTLDLFVGGMLAAYIYAYAKKRFEEHKPAWLAPAATIMSVFAFIALLELFKTEPVLLPVYKPDGTLPIQLWQSHVRGILLIIAMMIIVGGCFSYKAWIKLFANKIMVFLSVVSYNLYLWHAYIALVFKYRLKIPPYEMIDGLYPNMVGNRSWQVWYMLLVSVASIAVAVIITFGFEQPILRRLQKHSKNTGKLFKPIRVSLHDKKHEL